MEKLNKITLRAVQKKLGDSFVLDIAECKFERNKIYSLVGNNGAGKTTLLSLLCGLRKPTAGTILLNETEDLAKAKVLEALKWHMGVYLDESFMFDYYTPWEHFEFCANAFGLGKEVWEKRMEELNEIFQFEGYFDQLISTLSLGNKKKTGLLATLLSEPTLLIWDEPFSGLDPSSQLRLRDYLLSLQGKIIINSSHDLSHVADVSDVVFYLDNGVLSERIMKKKEITQEKLESFFLPS